MNRKLFRPLMILVIIATIASLVLGACAPAAAPTAAPAQPSGGQATAAPAPAEKKLAVGIVLPTKDEPRWLQDEARFKDALTKAGYDV